MILFFLLTKGTEAFIVLISRTKNINKSWSQPLGFFDSMRSAKRESFRRDGTNNNF